MSLIYRMNTRKMIRNTKAVIVALLIATGSFFSCAKQKIYDGTPVTVSVFNGLDNSTDLYGNYSESHPIVYAKAVWLENRRSLTGTFEVPDIRTRYFASPDTLAKDQPVIDKRFELVSGKSYSLYLMGDKQAADHLMVENKFKGYESGDSLTYMRIVNISNNLPISVNIKGKSNGSLVSSLSYKAVTGIIELKADWANPSYIFEFRDAGTGNLLATHNVLYVSRDNTMSNRYLYKNWTLTFVGKRGGTGSNTLIVDQFHHQ